MKYRIQTLGCKANFLDSQLIESQLGTAGFEAARSGDAEDVLVINTCSVTDEADRQGRRLVRQAKKKNPNVRVVLTGCGAEVDPEGLLKGSGGDFVVGNQDKHRVGTLIQNALQGSSQSPVLGSVQNYSEFLSRHPMDRDWPLPANSFALPEKDRLSSLLRTRAFLKVQEGCNSFCTYCIIPYGRGPSRSLPIENLIEQVNHLVSDGYQEVVLTGTNIGEYGVDLSTDGEPILDELVETILARTQLPRLRLSSLNPREITPRIQALVGEDSRLMAHFHVSLQSPHSAVLRGMKRKYRGEDVVECLTKLAQLPAPRGGVYVGMDVITGFPGETDAIYQESLQILRDLPWTRLHVFPYSERTGTPATQMKGSVPRSVRNERAGELRNLSLERLKGHYEQFLDSNEGTVPVLLEGLSRGAQTSEPTLTGYSSNYYRFTIQLNENDPTASDTLNQYKNRILHLIPEHLEMDHQIGEVTLKSRLADLSQVDKSSQEPVPSLSP